MIRLESGLTKEPSFWLSALLKRSQSTLYTASQTDVQWYARVIGQHAQDKTISRRSLSHASTHSVAALPDQTRPALCTRSAALWPRANPSWWQSRPPGS